jgi:5-methylthioadenosine/S-adenosylhomocysteine deaminase
MIGSSTKLSPPRSRLFLLKGGMVLTMDPRLGDFVRADVLIDGERIAAVGSSINAGTDVELIEVFGKIVMPGFVDTHRHMWQGQIRNLMPDTALTDYLELIHRGYGRSYRPEDVYVGNLVSALSAIDAGITTVLDWSHIQNSPEHTDAAIEALSAARLRAVFAYGFPQLGGLAWWQSKAHGFPEDIRRLRKRYFSSADQLLTLALAATGGFGDLAIAEREWAAARSVGAKVTLHAGEPGQLAALAETVGLEAGTNYVHCSRYADDDWKMIADSGGSVSISPSTEMLMNIGAPKIQEAFDHGISPALGVDAETNVPTSMFAQLHMALAAQRALSSNPTAGSEAGRARFMTARRAIELATIEGARALGLDSITGSLTPGKQADVIILRKDRINVMPVNDPYGAIALGMDSSNVEAVFVAGVVLKYNGELLGFDLDRLAERAGRSRDYLVHHAVTAGTFH